MSGQLHLTGPLGEQITVAFEEGGQFRALAQWGAQGYHSGEIPAGGFQLPLENESDFHWALLGGRKFTSDDGDACVWCRGHVWKRRELAAVDTRKMRLPAAVKYSRGAKPTDPPHLVETGEGDIGYVALAVFRGGRRDERFALPGRASQKAPPVEPPSIPSARPVPHLNHVEEGAQWQDLQGTADVEGNRDELTEQLLDALGKKGLARDAYRRDVLGKLDISELQKRHAQALVAGNGGRS
ncbi:single-stranded DNA-binding protein [Deinococcus peraridilitoris]|uniref:Uncharacterized protein n=1 Tax=Deinococcus peraridilitoris (strain DSM 19664 / LMG 22246 / CIP 109416 / KR-200) TaxID=937777 RepID=L0A1X9_DEIPD|nr:single-stranded DNA-binding protein [Deinococcus peraridilitoris]AFZ67015.1 hypothetical protein Deipe_1474 [Deinococcus peraridilitoris DSM 19664]